MIASVDFSGRCRDAANRRLKNVWVVRVGGGEEGVNKIEDNTRVRSNIGVATFTLLFKFSNDGFLELCGSGRRRDFGPSSISASKLSG